MQFTEITKSLLLRRVIFSFAHNKARYGSE